MKNVWEKNICAPLNMIREVDLASTLSELNSSHFKLTKFEPRQRHLFRRRVAHFQLGSLLMGVAACSAVRYASDSGAGYALGISLNGSARTHCDGKRYDIRHLEGGEAGGGGLILMPNMPFMIETSDIVSGIIRFDATRLQRTLVAISGNPRIKLPSAPVTGLNASRATLRAIINLINLFKITTSNCDDRLYLENIGIEDTIYRSTALIICESTEINQLDRFQTFTLSKLNAMRDMMISRLGSPPSLTDLSIAFNIKPRTLQRYFRNRFGMGPIEWMTEQRLLAAHKYISNNKDATVTETAVRFGFLHLGEFSRLFRARFGQLPRDIARFRGSLTP